MNILFIAWNFPPKLGGMENIVFNIYQRLKTRFNIVVLAPFASRDKEENDSAIIRCPFRGFLAFNFWIFYKGLRLIRNKQINLIFSLSFLTSPISIILGKIFNKEVITQVFGLDVIYPNFLYQLICRLFFPLNNLVISISNYTKQELLKRKVKEERIRVIYPGVDSQKLFSNANIEELKIKYQLQDKKIILSVCRLAKRKGIAEFILFALPKIIEAVPQVVYLVVGDNPFQAMFHKQDVMAQVKQAITITKAESYVKLLGGIDPYSNIQTLSEIYNLCDVFVLPVIALKDDIEGFGVVFLEASAAGKVTVGTNVGGIPDAIEDKKSGILIEPNDYARLAEEIIFLLKNDRKRKEMGEYGRRRVKDKFDWSVTIEEYSNTLNRLTYG
ncbi:MAG: glycosyltransferase family 4 protein [Candidatus Omnitrophota bacterium]